MTEAEWDERVVEALKRAFLECVKPEDFPLEPSDFQKYYNEFTLDGQAKVDLKKSSFKKIGKLLDLMSTGKNGKGYVDYFEDK